MENDSSGAEGDLDVLLGVGGPVKNLFNIILLDGKLVAVTDGALKQHADGVWKFFCTSERVKLARVGHFRGG